MRKLALLLGILALTHCAAEKAVYLRTDGQDVAGNAALRQQLELDRTTCQGEPGDEQDCMTIKGYVSVNKDKAAAKQQQLATIAAQRAANDRAIAVPPPPSATPDKTAKAKKPKSKPPESSLRSSQD